jgi:hypothetical protein
MAALGTCLHGLSALAADAGNDERSARLWGAGERLRESQGGRPRPPERALEEQYLAGPRAALGDRFALLEAEGRQLSLDDAVALASAEAQAAHDLPSLA